MQKRSRHYTQAGYPHTTISLLLATLLSVVISHSLILGTLPKNWKPAHVTPVFKRGRCGELLSYLSVALLSKSSEMMEFLTCGGLHD